MNLYYSTCPTGLEKLVARLASRSIRGFSLQRALPGAILYTAAALTPNCGGFHNTYLVLSQIPRSRHVAFAAQRFAADRSLMHQADQTLSRRKVRSVRVMFMEGNQLCTLRGDVRSQLERPIRAARIERETPESELVVLQRPEGMAFLLLRLTRGENTRHQLAKNELPAQLAWCMAALAQPRRGGSFLDPFAGSGALPLARAQFPDAQCLLAFDLDGEKVRQMKKRLPDMACVERQDAFTLDERLQKGSVTELVTDPVDAFSERRPAQYYLDMLRIFEYLLAPGARLVILVEDSAHFEGALKLLPTLSLREKYAFRAGPRHMSLYLCLHTHRAMPGPNGRRSWQAEPAPNC